MIDYDLFKEIELYAKRHVESSSEYYKSRNQSTDKMFKNCFDGKVAEWSNYFSLIEAGYIMKNKPDHQIYSQHNKSYEADLICIGKDNHLYEKEKHIHVKSISIGTYNKIGASFLIQKNDNLVTNPDPDHYFSVMLQKSLTHYVFYKWINSCDVSYSEPRANHLAATKLAVYL